MTTLHYVPRTPSAQNISVVILSCTPLFTLPEQDDDGAESIITGQRGGKEDFISFVSFPSNPSPCTGLPLKFLS